MVLNAPGAPEVARVGSIVEAGIERIAHGGEGVAHVEGLVVFVPWTAAGDRVRVEVVERRPRWARARLLDIVEPAALRIVPGCPTFEVCGGCRLQHLRAEDQRAAKSRAVEDALARIARIELPEPVACLPAAESWSYRQRATFTWRWDGEVLALGFHAAALPRREAPPGEIVDIARCPIFAVEGNRALPALREALATELAGSPPVEGRLVVRALPEGVQAGIFAGDPALAERFARSSALRARIETTWGTWWPGGPPVLARGAPRIPQRLAYRGLRLRVGFDSFLQADLEGAHHLYDAVLEALRPAAGERIVDGYAGVGVVACHLAAIGARVTAVESHPGAAADLRANAASVAGGNVHVLELPAERVDWRRPRPDTILVNPPRAGCAPTVLGGITRSPARRLVIVSCEPATLARDVKRLGGAWRLVGVRAFDLFPQTAHVEIVASLER